MQTNNSNNRPIINFDSQHSIRTNAHNYINTPQYETFYITQEQYDDFTKNVNTTIQQTLEKYEEMQKNIDFSNKRSEKHLRKQLENLIEIITEEGKEIPQRIQKALKKLK